ncbi:MAG: endonuclease [Carboxylicivirga sp.]|nr:endonuclease [Carboxylicivirga sp.]
MKHFLLLWAMCLFFQVQAQIVINEVDADTPGTDTNEFIELKTTTANMALDGYVVVLFNGSDDKSYQSFDLDGYTSDANGLFVLGTGSVVPSPDLVFSKTSNMVQNGPDAVAVYSDNASDFANDTPITKSGLLDVLIYDTSDGDDSGLLNGFGVTIQYDENAGGDKDNHSNQRKADGTFEAKEPTPGALNDGGSSTTTSVTISTDQSKYTEGESFDVKFTCSKAVEGDLVINYTLANGDFTSTDYNAVLTSTIADGSTSSTVSVSLVDDTDIEGTESLVLHIDDLGSAYQIVNNDYTVMIRDNDYDVDGYGTPVAPSYGNVSSTAPDSYYQSLNGLSGQALRAAITNLISDPNVARAQTYGDVWDILKEADVNPENEDEVWLIYTEQGRLKSAQQSTGSPIGKWNREHIYPQSRGGFSDGTSRSAGGKDIYMYTDATHTEHGHSDAHALRPADSQENSSRSNKDYGTQYAGPTGNAGSWKGDVARSVMYMALRYNSLDVVPGDPDDSTEGQLGDLNYLLQWHMADEADDYEMHRNNVIYEWQLNRNPFIDHPELADYVFGDKQNEVYNSATDIETPTNSIGIHPNPVLDQIYFSEMLNGNMEIYSQDGRLVHSAELAGKQYDLSFLEKGLYIYRLKTKQGVSVGKFLKK